MRLKYAKLIGLVGVCRASGLKEIYIDFTKSIHKIILIIGKNGSGKSTIEDALTPFPEQASKYYLSGEAGYKEIAYIMEDGIEYICKIEYPVNKLGERLQTKAYLEKIVDGVSTELNPNGNIGSYKDVLYSEFYLDANYIALSRLSVEDRGIVEKTPSERKKFVGNIISYIEVYNDILKTMNKRSSIFKSMMNSITTKIDAIGNEENLTKTLASLDYRIKALEQEKESLTRAISEAESAIRITDPGNQLQSKYSRLSSLNKSIEDDLRTINLLLQKIKVSPTNDSEEGMISFEQCLELDRELDRKEIQTQSEIDHIQSRKTQMLDSREEESRNINAKIAKLQSLKSEYNYQDLLQEIKATKANIQRDLDLFEQIGVSPDTALTKDEFITGLSTLKEIKSQVDVLRSFHYDNEIHVAVDAELQGISYTEKSSELDTELRRIDDQILEVRSDINRYEDIAKRVAILSQRPESCKIDSCDFIRDALEAESKRPQENLQRLNGELQDLLQRKKSCTEQQEQVSRILTLSYSIQIIIRYIDNNRKILDKLPNGKIFSDKRLFLDHLLNGNTFDEINNLYGFINQANVFEDYKNNVEILRSLKSEYKVFESRNSIIDELESDVETLNQKLNELAQQIEQYTQDIYEKEKYLQEIRTAKASTAKAIDLYNKKKELESQLEENQRKINEISSKMKDIEFYITQFNEVNQKLLNLNNELDPIRDEREKLRYSMDRLVEYNQELANYRDKYAKIELIKKYSSMSGDGIQNLFIEVYMGQTLSLANELLAKLFDGQLQLGKYVINAKEFRIPCKSLDSPIMNDDISSCSTAQKCMISMIISFVLLRQGSTKYNILRLDEIDGGLDQDNRAMFINVLSDIMEIMNVEHCLMISHASETVLEDTDIIYLDPNHTGEIPKGNIIFTYDDMRR